jgi:hypothetical protein
MAQKWEEIGTGATKQWKLTITVDGREPQCFYGKTKDVIAEQLANAQEHATTAIETLKRGTPQQPAAPRRNAAIPLQPNERMQVVSDMTNPAKVEQAVTRVVESIIGPVENIRQASNSSAAKDLENASVAAAKQFTERTPDWFPSDYNKRTLTGYMQAQGMKSTEVADYTRAFEMLKANGLLQSAPEVQDDNEEPPERIAPRPAAQPARLSTGVRSSDVSGEQTAPGRRLKYTRERIDKMGKDEYKRLLLSDPELTKAVEFYSRPQRRAV